jgi:hypothetical protein
MGQGWYWFPKAEELTHHGDTEKGGERTDSMIRATSIS